jgi:hypothetical protein
MASTIRRSDAARTEDLHVDPEQRESPMKPARRASWRACSPATRAPVTYERGRRRYFASPRFAANLRLGRLEKAFDPFAEPRLAAELGEHAVRHDDEVACAGDDLGDGRVLGPRRAPG